MASQYRRVTGNPSVRSGLANAKLQSRINNLPQMLANRQQKQLINRDTAFQNKQIAMQRRGEKQRKREQESAMGLEAAKLGLNIGMSDMGGTTLGDITTGAKNAYTGAGNLFRKNKKPMATNLNATGGPKSGWKNSVNVGGALSSGLTGFGVGKLVGGKSKAKKSLYGAGAGAAMGLLSANKGGGMMGGLIGGLTGGIGGYFS
jgi:hypothetical protein